ncbi:hypothetical protein [Pseudoalteromonas sp. T1lg23B]|uniref:hypothetical protein n=1 Tax=Pseudoalteromonas sp. T1lg23B TaxID=2077097 RepID=UPI001319D3CB|nr:hypothetical protein [Pseudoalteromonas sp. T1lg23B]
MTKVTKRGHCLETKETALFMQICRLPDEGQDLLLGDEILKQVQNDKRNWDEGAA